MACAQLLARLRRELVAGLLAEHRLKRSVSSRRSFVSSSVSSSTPRAFLASSITSSKRSSSTPRTTLPNICTKRR